MKSKELENWILSTYKGVIVTDAYRERSFFYNPSNLLPKGIYFATIKEGDGPNDKASNLDRDNVYRLSIGIGKDEYFKLFGMKPTRPIKGGIVKLSSPCDFTELNKVMPHPIYAWLAWIAVNSPTDKNLHEIKKMLDISYESVLSKYDKKIV